MRFDCVAGETGEPGEALQSQLGAATSAAKFFSFFFFARDRLGTAGRWKVAKTERAGEGEGGREAGLVLALTLSHLKRERGGAASQLHTSFLSFFFVCF